MFARWYLPIKDKFPIKESYGDKPLFRRVTNIDTLSERPLVDDRNILKDFAIKLSLPTQMVRGHGFRKGAIMDYANRVMVNRSEGEALTSNIEAIKMLSIWKNGFGAGTYYKEIFDHRVDLNAVTFGGRKLVKSMRDVIVERPAAYAVPKEKYLTKESAIVQDAVDLCEDLDELKKRAEEASKELEDMESNSKVNTNAAIIGARKRKRLATDILRLRRGNRAETYASYGNQLMMEDAKEEDLKTVVNLPKIVTFVDFEATCVAVEKYMETTALYPFGPFAWFDDCTMKDMKCYVKRCAHLDFSQSGIRDFLAHLLATHAVCPYTWNKEASEVAAFDAATRKEDREGQEKNLQCASCEKPEASLTKLLYHYRKMHQEEEVYVCITKGCGKRFRYDSKSLQTHRQKNPNHVDVVQPFPFADLKLRLVKPNDESDGFRLNSVMVEPSAEESSTSGTSAKCSEPQTTTADTQSQQTTESACQLAAPVVGHVTSEEGSQSVLAQSISAPVCTGGGPSWMNDRVENGDPIVEAMKQAMAHLGSLIRSGRTEEGRAKMRWCVENFRDGLGTMTREEGGGSSGEGARK